jgi:glycosyltransferase involved in cell wall biosynthesis
MFVLASKSETYGMVTIEAMASGLPVIGTAEGGTLDIIAHEKSGLLFSPMNEDELAEAMVLYVTQPELAARLADEAKRVATDRYSYTSQCEGWEKMINKIHR